MGQRMYKAGIIGAGWIGAGISHVVNQYKYDCHARAYKECADTELIFIHDAERERAKIAVRRWKVPLACIVEPIDIVSICTPPETHLEIVQGILALAGIKAIYLEKPIATTLEDADKIIKLCKLCGVTLQVNHQRRFMNPVMRFSRDIVDTGTHAFDLLRHLFGEIKELTVSQVTFESGFTVNIEYTQTSRHIFELDCTHNSEAMILKGVGHLVQCLKEGTQPISTGEDARRALELCLQYDKLATQS